MFQQKHVRSLAASITVTSLAASNMKSIGTDISASDVAVLREFELTAKPRILVNSGIYLFTYLSI